MFGPAVGAREETVKGRMIGQLAHRDELQPIERDMRRVEINRGDRARVGGQIGQDIAAARGDRHDMAVRRDRQRFHVDRGVFPDLRIDEAAKGEGEGAFEQALL